MNRKIYRAVVIVLVVLTIGQIIRFGFQLYGDQYHYHYDEDTFLYSIQDGQYSELPEKKNRNDWVLRASKLHTMIILASSNGMDTEGRLIASCFVGLSTVCQG